VKPNLEEKKTQSWLLIQYMSLNNKKPPICSPPKKKAAEGLFSTVMGFLSSFFWVGVEECLLSENLKIFKEFLFTKKTEWKEMIVQRIESYRGKIEIF
jgi:hypothetical protein